MRITRITLRDFRGVGSAQVEFVRDGVTIVEGRNEAGKSTIADAIDMLLSDPDSSTKARVKAAQPIGRDVGPFVEMQFETGPYRMTYSKQWVRGAATELRIHAPVQEQASGRAAHDRVEQVLAETLDAPLFAALRHHQGLPLDQADLGGSATLARALDVAAGGQMEADGSSALVDRIDAARQEWSTPTGSPNKARLDLRARAAEAGNAAGLAADELAMLEERIDDHRRLTADIDASTAREPQMRQRLQQLEAGMAEITARESAVRALEVAARAATADAQVAERDQQARAALVRAVEVGQGRANEAIARASRADEALAAADVRFTAVDAALGEAVAAGIAAQDALEAAAREAQAVRDSYDVQLLEERAETVRVATLAIAAHEEFLASCSLDSDLMEQIEQAALADAEARGRLQASGARLGVALLGPQALEIAGESCDIAPGQEEVIDLPAGQHLEVPGVLRVRAMAADEHAARHAGQCAEHLAALLVRAGVEPTAGPEAARALDNLRREHGAELAAAREARAQALRDLTPDELADKAGRARARVDQQPQAPAAEAAPPATLDEADEARARADSARDDARRAESAARATRSAAEADLREARATQAAAAEALEVERRRLADDAHALDAARDQMADDALAAHVERAQQVAAAAGRRHADEAAALAADDPESQRALLDNAREALDRLVRDRGTMALAAERALGEIGRAGDEGLADRAARAQAAAEQAHAESTRAEQRAAAADLLHSVMTRHRDDARRAYVAPFRAQVERLARLVFGNDVSVEVDHVTLRITSRTLAGVTVPFEALSGGAREQLAVIGRLAAAALAAPDGGAPVLIDDALGYSDPARLEGLGAALSHAGRAGQVIVLTCMPDRYAGVGGAGVVRLEPRRAEGSSSADEAVA